MSDRDLAEQVERILQASERTTDVFLDQGRVVEARAAIVQAQRALRDVGRRVGDEQREVRESFSAERLKADRSGRPAGASAPRRDIAGEKAAALQPYTDVLDLIDDGLANIQRAKVRISQAANERQQDAAMSGQQSADHSEDGSPLQGPSTGGRHNAPRAVPVYSLPPVPFPASRAPSVTPPQPHPISAQLRPTAPVGYGAAEPVAPSFEPSYYEVSMPPARWLPAPQLAPPSPPKKSRRGWIAVGILAGVVVVAGVTVLVLGWITSEDSDSTSSGFGEIGPNRIEVAIDRCGLAGEPGAAVGDEGQSLTLDTSGEEDLGGISFTNLECMISALDIPDAIESRILATRALDGVQDATYDEVSLSWSYHPDSGMTLIVSLA